MHGLKVLPRSEYHSASLLDRYRSVAVANVSDIMGRISAAGPKIRPYHGGGPLVGTAFTVKTRPGDNLLVLKAAEMALPGDVLVVDGGGDLTNALAGELLVEFGSQRALGGFVINGAIRDLSAIQQGSFPVFAAGVTHRGPYKDGPGEINVPVSIDGMVIRPGDIIVGDLDGVMCVPHERAEEVLALAEEKQAADTRLREAIRAGRYSQHWVDERINKLGYKLGAASY